MDYSPPSSATNFNAEDELARLVQHMQSTRETYYQEREKEKLTKAQERKKERFLKMQKEGKFNLDPRRRQPWRVGDQHILVNFQEKPLNLPAGDISPTTLHRTKHFLPRTFEEPEKPFISTTKTGQVFGKTDGKELSKSAQELFKKREEEFKAEVDRRRRQEMKRKQIVFANRWEPTQNNGRYFSTPHTDQYYLFEKSLKQQHFQSKPFLRTKRDGDLFAK